MPTIKSTLMSFMLLFLCSPLVLTAIVPEMSIHEDVTVGSFNLPEGYEMGTLGFSGTIDGIPVTANGTVEQIMEKTKHENPNWTPPNWTYQSRSSLEVTSSRSDSTINGITTRDNAIFLTDRSKSTRKCCKCDKLPSNWKDAYAPRIKQGISYLQNINGFCGVRAKACARISCSWSSAIFLCNDNNYHIDLSCSWLASYAQDILNDGCCKRLDLLDGEWVCGQETDTDHYNIMVVGDNC